MRKTFFLFSLLCAHFAFAQLNVGKSKSPINLYVSKHKPKLFDEVKTTKTIFVIPEIIDSEKYKTLISSVWTFNEIVFVEENVYTEELDRFIVPGNSILKLVDNGYTKTKGFTQRRVADFIVFKFMMLSNFENIKRSKKGKLKYDATNIAEIFFTPNIRYRQDFSTKTRIGSTKKINEKYGEEPGFYNFDFGYIKNYFQELNRRLSNAENLVMEDGVEKKEKIQELKRKPLYMPKWILKKFNPWTETWGKTRTEQQIFEKYEHEYKVIDNNSLSEMILEGKDFYYLMHTQFNQKKIVSIIHSITGEIIYLKESGSYNIDSSDLKAISKLVK